MVKKHLKDVKGVVEEFFSDYDIEQGGKHIAITIRFKGRTRKITASGTPSCRHATNQLRRDMRRIMNEFTANEPAGAGWAKS